MVDFYTIHPHATDYILFLFAFPRLTMLAMGTFMSHLSITYVLGWAFCPRLTIAILATAAYWSTNPILCVFAWINFLIMFAFLSLLKIVWSVLK